MVLSDIALNWHLAAKPYEWHRALWRLFPNRPAESRRSQDAARDGFLFRVERMETGRGARLLVLSDISPHDIADGIQVVRTTTDFTPTFPAGHGLTFKLTANPVKTIVDKDGRVNAKGETKKCRVPLIKEEQQRDWLSRHLDGIAILDQLDIRQEQPVYFRKDGVGKIVPVTFEGRITVTDGQRLAEVMRNGIGPAKAFGCGLLLVRRG